MIGQRHVVTEVLLILSGVAGFYQAAFYWIVNRRFAFYHQSTGSGTLQPVSVIICAKNEVNHLRAYLPAILDQDYPDFEVIVVNDCSWDESGEYLEEMEKKHTRLRIVDIQEQEKYRHGKKFALTLGIKASRHEWLLMTDADCEPASRTWIRKMQESFSRNPEIVLGYGPYRATNGFLNKMIRFDAFQIAMQYFGCAIEGNAYMGVGRNLAYKKSLFFRNKGFAKHNHLFSGDDDLFVNECATNSNTLIETHPESFTYSDAKTSFKEWFRQKRRHFSTGKYYKSGHRLMLFMAGFTSPVFYLCLVALLVLRYDWRIIVSLYGGLLLLKLPILWLSAAKLREKDLVWRFPILDLSLSFIQPLFFISNLFTKQKAWK